MADAVRKMRKMTSRKLNLSLRRPRSAIAATLGSCLICLLLLPDTLHALDPNKRLTQYIHKSWRIEDGSAPAGMFSIAQTSDGFLWFAAQAQGLYRFDGVQFVPRSLSADGKSVNPVVNVYGDRTSGLWVLGPDEIVHLKGGTVAAHYEARGLWGPNNVIEGRDGWLWIMRAENQAVMNPLCRVDDREMKCFGAHDRLTMPSGGFVLTTDGSGGFWLGGQTTVIHWHEGVSHTYPIDALKSNTGNGVGALALSPDGTLWVGLLPQGPGLGLGRLMSGVFHSFVTPGFDGSKLAVQTLTFDRDGCLWVGTIGNGLFRIRGNAVEHYGRAEGLSSDSVNHLFEDKEGIVWAATTNGVDSFRDPRVTTFSAAEGLGPDAAVGLVASRDGSIWVANGDSLDHIEKNGTVSSIRWGKGLPGDQVSSMLEDRAGNLWVGVYDGLYLFKNGQFLRIPEPDHQPLGLVTGIAEDIDGDVWVEGLGRSQRLLRIHDFQVREQFSQPGHDLAADPHGGIWISSGKDLVLFRRGSVQKFPLDVRGPSSQVLPEADGSVLAATPEGLLGLRRGKVQRLAKKNGLPCDFVISAVEDKEKHWWLFTDCGIVDFADSELERWWANPEAVLHSRLSDTLDGARPGRPSFNAAALSPDGRVWFATGTVVQMVDPSKLSKKAEPAETYIESVVVDRKEFPATDNLKLSPHPHDLQIDYTSPTFLIPQRVKFRYRLDGYDRDWHEAGTRRQAFYTDLRPGKYFFRVIACNSDGVWDETPAELKFFVAPAYYQTNWFRALCVAFFLALLWAAYRWRVRQLHHQFEITLDARVGERTRIARELHDTLLQSFHGLLLRFETVSQMLPEQSDAKEKLDSVIEQAADAITEGRDAVQGLRDSTTQTNDLAVAVSALGEELLADPVSRRPAFRITVEGESRNLHPILRDEVYKISAEALRNAFSHSSAYNVEVEIRYDNEQFRLRVRDDGKGIDPAVLSAQGSQGHYGLPGMRERAKIMGAKLTVWSEVDAGTEVELRLPAGIAYAKDERRSWLTRKLAAKAKVADR